jgi:hypothetical protein
MRLTNFSAVGHLARGVKAPLKLLGLAPQNMLGRLLCSSSLIPKKGLNVSSQRKFHFGFCMFKAARLNSDGELLAIPTPPVIRQPEFAFHSQKRRYPEHNGVISHRFLPHWRLFGDELPWSDDGQTRSILLIPRQVVLIAQLYELTPAQDGPNL